ncbi:regulatory protein, luxR family [Lentzea waywayandensis]|uniref:Regulatory protein, luxR family n=1 Tax=Lentzea waywayandensis TaxID=84724 RepID=A0A1I6FET1_9PSEU|nr:LuxR family transcriptional regulator [Lentzea waywayandensis]SFR28414.1 regulatory protein, luxR family [Lentzea waywayandensis]
MRGVFVGRVEESELLAGHLDEARLGSGRLVLIGGEPGIGKTRLACEVAARAEASDIPVVWGRASDDEGSPPYWLFRQIARALNASLPSALVDGGTTTDSMIARFEAFETFSEQLREHARHAGLVVVLDDLQWADAASMALLVHVARGMARSRLLLVATYRDTEPSGGKALADAFAAVSHEAGLVRVRLAGLLPVDVHRQLEAAARVPVTAEIAALVCHRTGGNPFFVNEMVPLLDSAAEAVPDGVLDTVRARLARLDPVCRELVAVAASLGSGLDASQLAAVTGRPLETVLNALDEASAAGLLAPGENRQFRHDLIREAARADLPTATRARAHAQLATWLATRPDAAERVAEIAHHWLASAPVGDPCQAAEWAERAGDQALDRLAWEEAAGLYRRALEAGAPLTAGDRASLLLRHATALARDGDLQSASEVLSRSAEAARAANDPEALGAVALAMEGVSNPWGDFVGGRLAIEALAQLRAEDSSMRARLLALVGGEASFVGGPDADRYSAEALAMAERLEDVSVLRSALRSRQMARSGPDGVHERLALAERMSALGEAEQDDDTRLWGWLWRFDAFMMLGRIDDAEAALPPMRRLAERLRRPLATWHYLRSRTAIEITRGRFDDAVDTARRCIQLVDGRTHSSAFGVSTFVLILLDGLTGLDLLTDEQHAEFERSVPANLLPAYGYYWAQHGDFDRARRLARSVADEGGYPRPVLLSAVAVRAELAWLFDERKLAARMAGLLRPHADLFVTGGAGSLANAGSVRTYLGLAEAACGHFDDGVRQIRLGIAADDTAGIVPHAAFGRWHLACVLSRRHRPGDTEEAVALCAGLMDTTGHLGMHPLRRRVAELAAKLRGDVRDGLTRREAEIAGHVAQGLTNKQIAALLHLSERTVETHVQHILAKLGLANRTQIAAWSAQQR